VSGKENRHTLRAGQETGDAANRDEKKKRLSRLKLIEPSGARSIAVQRRAQESTERTRTREINTLARRGNSNQKRLSRPSNQKRLSRPELTGVAWGSQHGSPAESTGADRANSQQRNPAENTRSDRTKGGANSPEPAAAVASAQEQNGERTQTEMEETPRQRLKRIEADAGRSNPGCEKRNRRRTGHAHWTESTNEEHFKSEPETKS
jgi:hypothetical protein